MDDDSISDLDKKPRAKPKIRRKNQNRKQTKKPRKNKTMSTTAKEDKACYTYFIQLPSL